MTLFVIGTAVFSVLAVIFTLFLALWTYEDAKVKSDQSPVLWLLVVIFANPVGFIIYLIVGRSKKDVPAPGKFKGLLVASLVVFLLSAIPFTTGLVRFVGENTGIATVRVGSFAGSWSTLNNNEWSFRARNANGHERRSPNLSAEQLANFHVLSDSGEGISLRLEQGEITQIIDISGFFDEYVSMNAFEPGRVRVTLEFDRARDVDVRVSWREPRQ